MTHPPPAFDGSPVGMALVDPEEGRPVEVNDALCRLLGRSREELSETSLAGLVHAEDRPAYDGRLRALLRGEAATAPLEIRYLRPDGGVLWAMVGLAVHRDDAARVRTVSVQLVDLTMRRRTATDPVRVPWRDPLTQLPDRASLLETLDRALARTRRAGQRMAVLLLDVDRVAAVNGSLGHGTGDALLREVAARLRKTVRAGDTVARSGGDEFVVVAEPCTERDAVTLAGRIGRALAPPVSVEGRSLDFSVSIGIAESRGEHDARGLLRDAGAAASSARARGGARCEVFDPELRRRADARLDTEQSLRRALERDEIVPFYQPVLSSTTGEVRGFEALARWVHPEQGVLAPGAFLDVAAETGLIVDIGSDVLGKACRDLAGWNIPGEPRLWVSVNIDAEQLRRDSFVNEVRHALADSGLAPHRLRLELTETGFLDVAAVDAVRRIRALGVRLAVDDFGTGYSSLHYLRRLPVDVLKMDRSFIEDIDRDGEVRAVVRAVVDLSHSLGLLVVAEGVETTSQLAALRSIGCDMSQGFLFARPMPFGEARDYARARLDAETPRPSAEEPGLDG